MATLAALAALGRDRLRAAAQRQADDRHRAAQPATRSAARPGFAVGAIAALASNLVLRPGPVDAVADGRLGAGRRARRGARARRAGGAWGACRWPPPAEWPGLLYGAILDYSTWVTFSGDAHARRLSRLQRDVAVLQPRPRGRQRRLLPGLRARPSCARCCASARASRCAGSRSRRRRSSGLALVGLAGAARGAATAGAPTCAPRRTATAASARAKGQASSRSTRLGGAGPGGASRPSRRARARATCAAGASRRQRDVGDIERTILGARRAGRLAARAPTARDLVARLLRARRAATARGTAWSTTRRSRVLALRAAAARRAPGARCACAGSGASPTATAASASPRRGAPSGIDDTAARRPGAGRGRPAPGARRCAAPWASSSRARTPTAASRCSPGAPSNAQSTAWAVQALVAARPRSRPRAPRRLADPAGVPARR